MIDHRSIGRLLLETRRITKSQFQAALRASKETGKSLPEILLMGGKVSVEDLIQAITMHVDITLLKEALGMNEDATGPARRERPIGSYLERISLLFKMGVLISKEKNMSSLLDLLLREAPSVMNAERATIFLADHNTRELYSHVGVGLKHAEIRIPWDSGIAGWVYTHGESLNIAEPYSDSRFNKDVDPRTGYKTKNLLCVPLRTPGGPIIGVFQVLNKRAGIFTRTDTEILEILASQAARSIEHAIEWDHLRERASMLRQENVGLRQALRNRDQFEEIVGNAPAVQYLKSLIRKVAPTDTSVLIQGESGTGKELVAKTIYRLSRRADRPLVSLNCAAVPSELIESELFGHKKGSFTGAVEDHKGVLRAADKGTLFLDEIEAMSPAMQVKLLRAIQSGEIKPVGESASSTVDVRLIAATNRNLADLVRQGLFREDLFYRINVFPITTPPLRERIDDLPLLIRYFLDKLAVQTGKAVRGVEPVVMDLLMRYPWPGNIRELENEIERAHILTADGGNLSVRSLSARITSTVEKTLPSDTSSKPKRYTKLKDAIDDLELRMLHEALRESKGNQSLAAKRLGLSRQGLANKMKKFDLR